ncbi:Ppx/GppA family phosphatase [Lacicoccus alkaliphilus]|uniref:Exopolyphosphatase / guanosine-5'-triphosphate,3'-diphosphate pyrophosphatase n=1 Tax=Lacicoccus alkaliphilus DSM 16010 TaxID=1123231 RepID=A0A1M7A6V0_9BACL|nr:Ppx/GppA family phosphatase [Salinicoccus alkaliphilus]SHL38422.1 exopolyphosphatase / guanosine-5'-triphosphate,3'-diphosphate pyrophosphatase [Salinicoccus alkaliphilus DSM 16010]
MLRIGLIDIGSNTVRLVLFEYTEETGLKELQNIKTPARLARYLTEDDLMEEEGVDLLVDILKSFQLIAGKYDVVDLYPVATAAIRKSSNVDDIVKRVKQELGIDIKVITGKEEAYYGFHAVTHTISNPDAVTIDIGGGSTELTFYEDKELIYSTSIPYGVVTLQEMFFEGKAHNDEGAIKEARKHIEEELGKVRWLSKRRVPILAIGGSARNVARIHQSMINYPIAGVHGYSLERDGLDDVMDILRRTDEDDLDDIDGLSRDRSDIILPSLLVFQTLYDLVDAREFKFSRKGLREGLAMSLISKEEPEAFNKHKIYEDAMDGLANDFKLNRETAAKRTEITERVYHELNRHDLFSISKHDKYLLKNAAKIFYLGDFIDRDATSQHTFYLLANSNINGIVHRDRVRLALIASFKNKTLLKFYAEDVGWFDDEDIKLLLDLGSILKFSNALNISHTNIVHDLYLDENEDGYVLTVEYKGDPIAEEYQASRQKKHIEKILGEKMAIKFIEA